MGRLRRLTKDRVRYAPYQTEGRRFPEIPWEEFERSVQFVEKDGSLWSGAEAAYRTLSYAAGWRWLLWGYGHVPGFARLSEKVYDRVSRHRHEL